MRDPFLLLCTLCLTVFHTYAQSIDRQVAATAGGEFVNPAAMIAYTIGEPLIFTLNGGTDQFTQGFHQGTVIVTAIPDQRSLTSISVYPNPLSDQLTVNLSDVIVDALWQMQTIDGRVVQSGGLVAGPNHIDVTRLAQATYILTISTPDRYINTYRIVKMQ
jgi:hypothetical protein